MSPAPLCISCGIERVLVGISPVKNRHEMLQYDCPKCGSTFNLVAERQQAGNGLRGRERAGALVVRF
jgi:predicted RNA-binding Zn-ribbon protein involved in translation (DUF1610 family)